jgi:hypothetical protein
MYMYASPGMGYDLGVPVALPWLDELLGLVRLRNDNARTSASFLFFVCFFFFLFFFFFSPMNFFCKRRKSAFSALGSSPAVTVPGAASAVVELTLLLLVEEDELSELEGDLRRICVSSGITRGAYLLLLLRRLLLLRLLRRLLEPRRLLLRRLLLRERLRYLAPEDRLLVCPPLGTSGASVSSGIITMSAPAIGAAPGGGAAPPTMASLGTIIVRRGVMPRAALPVGIDYFIRFFKVMRTGTY